MSAANNQLQHPRPTVDPSVPPFAKNIAQTPPPPPCRERICGYSIAKRHMGHAEREISVLVYGYFDFRNPPYMASRQLMIPRIAAAGTSFSPLPCQAWHGYMVISAHRVEIEVGADGLASTPPPGPPPLRRQRAPPPRLYPSRIQRGSTSPHYHTRHTLGNLLTNHGNNHTQQLGH
jgi:hypothetical protein